MITNKSVCLIVFLGKPTENKTKSTKQNKKQRKSDELV